MNWMGGARSRITRKDEKRKQQDFFARMRLMKQTNRQALTAFTPSSVFFNAKESVLNANTKNNSDTQSTLLFQNTALNMNSQKSLGDVSRQNKPSSIIFSNSRGVSDEGLVRSNTQQRFNPSTISANSHKALSSLDKWTHEIHNHKGNKKSNSTIQKKTRNYGSCEEPEVGQHFFDDFQMNMSSSFHSEEGSPSYFKSGTEREDNLLGTEREKLHSKQKYKFSPTVKSSFYSPKPSDSERRLSNNIQEIGVNSYLTPSSSNSSNCTSFGIKGNKESVLTLRDGINLEVTNECPKHVSTPSRPITMTYNDKHIPLSNPASTPLKGFVIGDKNISILNNPASNPFKVVSFDLEHISTYSNPASSPFKVVSFEDKHISPSRNSATTPVKVFSIEDKHISPLSKPASTAFEDKHVSSLSNPASTPFKVVSFEDKHISPSSNPGYTPFKVVSSGHNRIYNPRNLVSQNCDYISTPIFTHHNQIATNNPIAITCSPVSTSYCEVTTSYNQVSLDHNLIATPPKLILISNESSRNEQILINNESMELSHKETKRKDTRATKEATFFPTEKYYQWLWKEILDQLFFVAQNVLEPDCKVAETVIELPQSRSSLPCILNAQKPVQTREIETQTETTIPSIADKGIQVDTDDLRFNFLLTKKISYSV